MSETTQDSSPKDFGEFRSQVAASNPKKWGINSKHPVETSDRAFVKWMGETGRAYWRKDRVKHVMRRLLPPPFRRSDKNEKQISLED